MAARRKEKLEGTVAAIREAGGEAVAVSADVTKQEDIDRIVAETLKAYGRIDILVSNAGMALPGAIPLILPGKTGAGSLILTWMRGISWHRRAAGRWLRQEEDGSCS